MCGHVTWLLSSADFLHVGGLALLLLAGSTSLEPTFSRAQALRTTVWRPRHQHHRPISCRRYYPRSGHHDGSRNRRIVFRHTWHRVRSFSRLSSLARLPMEAKPHNCRRFHNDTCTSSPHFRNLRQVNLSSWGYLIKLLVGGLPATVGNTHFQEVAFVFDNVHGLGYENAVTTKHFASSTVTPNFHSFQMSIG